MTTSNAVVAARNFLIRYQRSTRRVYKLDLKRYFRRMWIVSEEMEAEAVREFGRLMHSPVARERITAFASGGRMPWER